MHGNITTPPHMPYSVVFSVFQALQVNLSPQLFAIIEHTIFSKTNLQGLIIFSYDDTP